MEELEVPTEHLHEKIHEHAEEGKEKWALLVALSTAVIAVLAAITGLIGNHHSDEALLDQMKSSDHWAQYQAKGIKSEINGVTTQLLTAFGKTVPTESTEKLKKYEEDKAEIKKLATEEQEGSEKHMTTHLIFAKAVTIFQISIAISAIAILTKKKPLWYGGLLLAAAGIFFMITGFLSQ